MKYKSILKPQIKRMAINYLELPSDREIIDRRVKTLINIVISHEKYKDYKKLEKGWMRYYGLCKRVKLNTYRTEKEVKQIK